MSRRRMDTVSLAEVTALGEDDRKAVMEMVRDGEMDMSEAIAKVKELTSKKVRKRAGAVKRKRGRIELEITVLKSHFSVIMLNIKTCVTTPSIVRTQPPIVWHGERFVTLDAPRGIGALQKARDLMQVGKAGLNPFVRAYITPAGSDLKPAKPQTTKTRKNSTNPMFDEDMKWTLEGARAEKGDMRLHLSVETAGVGIFGRSGKKVIGCMSFALDELFNAPGGKGVGGWYRLLDPNKGQLKNMPYQHHKPLLPPVEAASAPAPVPGRRSTTVDQSRPLPQPPSATSTRPTSSGDRRHSTPSNPTAEMPPVVPSRTAKRNAGGSLPELPKEASEPQTMDGFDTIDEFSPSTTTAPTSRAPSSAPPRQLAKATADSFTYLKVLGQGSFGKVLLAEHKTTKEIYAIKVIKKLAVIEDDDIEATMTERRVLALSANCPFLTGLFATFQAADKLFYVMELIGGGDLMFHIQNDKVFSVPRARFYGAEICLGLWYLHSKGVIYRDLKLDNVMLDEWGHVKIADFGMCKENIFNKDKTTTFCGTPGYLAPEIINEKPYNSSVDWWSLGVLMYEMIIGDSPFDADDDDELFRQILTLKLEYPRNLDASARDVCSRFLVRDPSKRLGSDAKGADGIRAHPFFAEIDWDKLSKREIPPPFAPKRSEDKKAALNFDSDFTDEDPSISPAALRDTRQIDQALFSGFSFATQAFLESAGDAGEPPDEFDEAFGTVDATPCLEDQAWFVPSMSRVEVANALRDKPIGTCLVRPSATQPGCYVLSVTVRAAAPWSGLVVPGLAGGFRIAKEHQFDTMVQLVEHYTSNPIARTIRGAPVMLRLLDPDATTAC